MRTVYNHPDGKSFGLRTGKAIAQGSHSCLADLAKLITDNVDKEGNVSFKLTSAQLEWYNGNFRKVVLRVDTEAELMAIYDKAKEVGVSVELIIDSGLTEFHGIPTKTCLALGPDYDEVIDKITGENGPLGRLRIL